MRYERYLENFLGFAQISCVIVLLRHFLRVLLVRESVSPIFRSGGLFFGLKRLFILASVPNVRIFEFRSVLRYNSIYQKSASPMMGGEGLAAYERRLSVVASLWPRLQRWRRLFQQETVHLLMSRAVWGARLILFVALCLLAAGEAGPISRMATQALVLACALGVLALEWPGVSELKVPRAAVLFTGLLSVCLPTKFAPAVPVLLALGLARGSSDRLAVWRLGGLALFLALKRLYLHIPAGWYAAESLGRAVSGSLSPLVGWTVQLGPSVLGVPAFVLVLTFAFWGAVLLGRERPVMVWLPSVLAAVLFYLQAYIRVRFIGASLPTVYSLWWVSLLLSSAQALALLPLASLDSAVSPEYSTGRAPSQRLRIRMGIAPLLLEARLFGILVCIWLAAVALARPSGSGGSVVIFKDGAIPWGLPDPPHTVTRLSDGKVGLIEHYLRSIGFKVRWHEGELNRRALAGADVLLTMNLNRPLSKAETDVLWNWVRGGGSLLVCGDHTDYVGLVTNYGRLLKPVGIGFNFDSAVPLHGSEMWRATAEFRPSPIALEDWIPTELSVSIGASLRVRPPAVPVMVGRYGFSDPGDRTRAWMGSLGNLTYDRGERLGDVVLVAAAQHGRGKVLVFGDTSSFMNYSLPSSYRFVGVVFRWLADKRVPAAQVWPAALLLIGLAVAFVLRKWSAPVYTAAAAAIFCIALPAGPRVAVPIPKTPMLAVVDVSHLAPLPPAPGPDHAVAGMNRALMRRGYLPLMMNRWDRRLVDAARLVVLPGPAKDFSTAELVDLERFIAKGGALVACVGWETAWLTPNLLSFLGVEVGAVPLGSADGKRIANVKEDVPLHFVSAWPVTGPGYSTIYQAWGRPVVIGRYRGKGRIVVIGDTKFLLKENLEGEMTFYGGNLWLFNVITEP